jgi:rhamnose transport system permease protein
MNFPAFLKKLPGRETLLALMVVAVALIFGIGHPNFLDPQNLADRSRYWVEIGLIAVPMTFIIASGGIDLSVGSLLALAGIAAGKLQLAGLPLPAVIAGALAVGTLGGLFNAFAIQALRLPPLVVTLATHALFRGLTYGLTGAQPISTWPDAFTDWGSLGAWQITEKIQVPWSFLILLGVVAIGTALFHRHMLGRETRQLGENPSAARFAGISAARITYAIYGFSGLMCGLSAIIWTSRFATAHPGAAQGLELEVIAVVVLGGTRITGGAGSVPGTFLGLLLLGLLRYGLELRGVSQQDQTILVGTLLVVVALANEAWARRSSH